MRMAIGRVAATFFVMAALLMCGCGGNSDSRSYVEELPKVDPTEIATGKPKYDGWLDGAVKYCKEHDNEKGVLVDVTGMMADAASDHGETDMLVLVMPGGESDDPEQSVKVKSGDVCADVYFAEPIQRTPWRHLIGVRGIATLDPSQSNKIIIRGAMESED